MSEYFTIQTVLLIYCALVGLNNNIKNSLTRQDPSAPQHSVTSQKNSINNISTVETSNIATEHHLPAQQTAILHPNEQKYKAF
jgi:hypothetical protein